MSSVIQTNRTLLFEGMNSNIPSILTLIGEAGKRESLSEEELKTIHETLVVHSLEEYIEIFKPSVYLTMDPPEYTCYCSKEPITSNLPVKKIPLDMSSPFLINILKLLDSKEKAELITDSLSDFRAYMSIQQEQTEFYKIRRILKEVFLQISKENGVNSLDAKEQIKCLYHSFDDSLFLLELYVKDFQMQLDEKESKELMAPLYIKNIQESQVDIINSSQRKKPVEVYLKEEAAIEYRTFIRSLLQEHPFQNKKLLEDALTMYCEKNTFELEGSILRYNIYVEYYQSIVNKFVQTAKPVVESLLNIKAYFEQYNSKAIQMKPALLITNCDILNFREPKYMSRLRLYLKSVNETNYESLVIWYAILPHLSLIQEHRQGIPRERFRGNRQSDNRDEITFEYIKQLFELLKEFHIQTFISNKPMKETSFRYVAEQGITAWEEALYPLRKMKVSEYIIPCYPNFTILPEKDAFIEIESSRTLPNNTYPVNKEHIKIRYKGIHIEAAYVAAGILSACQCPAYLNHFFPDKVNAKLPGVAYQLCHNGQNKVTTANMYREILGYPPKVREEIRAVGSGIIFGTEDSTARIIALTDTTLASIEGFKEVIANVQTLAYIERVFKRHTMDYKMDLVRLFFQQNENSVITSWRGNKEVINAILKEGEELTYEIDEAKGIITLCIIFTNSRMEEKIRIDN